jgi:hypothetical protein
MVRSGLTAREIADRLGITQRSVFRLKAAAGLTRPHRPMTPDELTTAEHLIDEGASLREAARTLDRSPRVLNDRYPGRGFTPAQAAERRRLVTLERKALAS